VSLLARDDDNTTPAPTKFTRALWILLPACASILLLATTNKICLDVAVIPFLWVLPLSLYLLTFILCFDSPHWYARRGYHIALLPASGLLCYALWEGPAIPLVLQIGIYTAVLWIFSTVCHGELCLLKPSPRFLTGFYLSIATGGAIGGVAVAIVAPLIFHSYAELNWGAWLVVALVALIHFRERIRAQIGARRFPLRGIALAFVLVFGFTLHWQSRHARAGLVAATRNFYGLLRMFEIFGNDPWQHAYRLQSGEVVHGLQFTEPARAREANTYYDMDSGVALALQHFPGENRRIGVVGLGCGSVAVYGKRGDTFRFYEINPEVQRLAESHFSFLSGTPAKVEVVLGDARLRLEAEPPQQFDVLVLDAFSSDAIPVHLLTREAFAIYRRHLRPDGIIVVHMRVRLAPSVIPQNTCRYVTSEISKRKANGGRISFP
jgi:SAM-dependent methyltransferase